MLCCEVYCGSFHDFKRPHAPSHSLLMVRQQSSPVTIKKKALRDASSNDCKGGDNLGYNEKVTTENVSHDGIFAVNKL